MRLYTVTANELETTATFADISRAYAFRGQLEKLGYTAKVQEKKAAQKAI